MDQVLVTTLKDNYDRILDRIGSAACGCGRSADEIRLVVVTKTQPVSSIRAALEAGATCFGENYADETLPKILELGPAAQWHMIGHIQGRKARIVAEHFDFVHSLDSLALAERLNKLCVEAGRRLPVLLEFNLANEETKTGWQAAGTTDLEKLIGPVEQIAGMLGLEIRGLMTMPPLSASVETSRGYFRLLANFRAYLQRRFPTSLWDELSMGTSGDFETAIQEGATMVRIGQAIFGPRIKNK